MGTSEAEPLYERALKITEAVYGPEHPNTAASLNNLALLYSGTGRYAEAEPLYKRALAIREKVLGPEHPRIANSLNNLAALYLIASGYDEAELRQRFSTDRRIGVLTKPYDAEHLHAGLRALGIAIADKS